MHDSENLRLIWKNVRKIRMRENQLGLEERMSMYASDICAINKTLLNCNEYLEVSNLYRRVGKNRDWPKGKYGGTGFIMNFLLYMNR